MTNASVDTRTVVIERDMPYPPEKLWRALTQPHLLAEWLMDNDFTPAIGKQFKFTADWGSVDCRVLEIEPNRTLSYTWAAYGVETVVTWTLTPSQAGTHLRIEQTGFDPDNRQAFHGARAGWTQFLGSLDTVLARAD